MPSVLTYCITNNLYQYLLLTEWEIEAILREKKMADGVYFYVKWKGYKKCTWEPTANIAHLDVKILKGKGKMGNKKH